MDPQFEELARHIADDVEKRFSKRFDEAEKRLEGVIVGRLHDAEKRLSDGARMHMEELRTTVKVVAEGYGATLDRIERQLTELHTKVDTKFSDHDKIFENHAARIAALEQSKVR